MDYCIVDAENYNRYSSFAVKTMCEIIQTLDYNEISHIPDQSLLTWHMDLEGVDVNSIHPHGPEQPPEHIPEFNLQKIPSDFMASRNEELLKTG